MNSIKVRPDLIFLILNGSKTATTRLGVKDFSLGPTEFVCSETGARFGGFIVTKLVLSSIEELPADLYLKENYSSNDELREVLEKIYGKLDDEAIVTVAYFEKDKNSFLQKIYDHLENLHRQFPDFDINGWIPPSFRK